MTFSEILATAFKGKWICFENKYRQVKNVYVNQYDTEGNFGDIETIREIVVLLDCNESINVEFDRFSDFGDSNIYEERLQFLDEKDVPEGVKEREIARVQAWEIVQAEKKAIEDEKIAEYKSQHPNLGENLTCKHCGYNGNFDVRYTTYHGKADHTLYCPDCDEYRCN